MSTEKCIENAPGVKATDAESNTKTMEAESRESDKATSQKLSEDGIIIYPVMIWLIKTFLLALLPFLLIFLLYFISAIKYEKAMVIFQGGDIALMGFSIATAALIDQFLDNKKSITKLLCMLALFCLVLFQLLLYIVCFTGIYSDVTRIMWASLIFTVVFSLPLSLISDTIIRKAHKS